MRSMARGAVARSKALLLREAKRADHQRRHFSKRQTGAASSDHSTSDDSEMQGKETIASSGSSTSTLPTGRCSWVPHPTTGIYVPEGHESVMDGVPKGAASLDRTFWLRNVDGVVERPDPETRPEHYYNYMHM